MTPPARALAQYVGLRTCAACYRVRAPSESTTPKATRSLRSLRLAAALTLEDSAFLIGTSEGGLSRVENGRRRLTQAQRLRARRVLGLTAVEALRVVELRDDAPLQRRRR